MNLAFEQVDAFTDRPFAGNPAAVFVLPAPRGEAWMQAVAREMNLSETAFLVREGELFRLRWFTPALEVDLCGHATLAAAHALWERKLLSEDAGARFATKSGELGATKHGTWIELDFPATPPVEAVAPVGLVEALGCQPLRVMKSRFDWLVELHTAAELRSLAPDFTRLRAVPARGIIVTSKSDVREFDFLTRFFAPRAGVDEDPVTGSAHCALAPYWSERLGKTELRAFQASARGGVLKLRIDGNRVKIGGQAVTVMRGELVAGE